MKKPQNHVTKAQRLASPMASTPFPDLTQAQVDWLMVNAAPKCYDPRRENLEEHLQYAGLVRWAESIIGQWESREAHDGEVNLSGAERAQEQ